MLGTNIYDSGKILYCYCQCAETVNFTGKLLITNHHIFLCQVVLHPLILLILEGTRFNGKMFVGVCRVILFHSSSAELYIMLAFKTYTILDFYVVFLCGLTHSN